MLLEKTFSKYKRPIVYYVYLLLSVKDNKLYTGYTDNLDRRLYEHNKGLVDSTKYRRPFELLYYEWSLNKKDAQAREKYLKSGMGKKYLRNRNKHYLEKRIDKAL